MRIAGIDYSLTSPAITVFEGDVWDSSKCHFHYLHKKESLDSRFHQSFYPEWTTQEERHDKLSDWALKVVEGCDIVFIEGYAYGGSGRVFNLAENTGLLKHKIWKAGIKIVVEPPSVFKKFATDKGNATKEVMYDFFVKDSNIKNIKDILSQREKDWNPSSDIVDAYFICKWGIEHGIDKLRQTESDLLSRTTKQRKR